MQSSYGEELAVGDKIAGRYEVLSVLGKGSMGVVYKARHDILERIVAIKTLRVQRIIDDRSAKRFEREAKVTCMVEHPNIIKVFDFGYTGGEGIPYLVMDFVSGIPLYNILKEERTITVDRAVVLFSQVCDGLYHAHQRGVIHRDLKPANIMVVKKEHEPESVRIVDLGVAKIVATSEEEAEAITRTGEVCGSPIYLSPEQCVYQELDPRTDIYSLGVCLYESLTGIPPLRGATVYDTIYMHVNEEPKPFRVVAESPC
jgi:eukaryotic-like serine/threonine-protein kinase